jgi:hypothetical protein
MFQSVRDFLEAVYYKISKRTYYGKSIEMREIASIAAYLVSWLFCELVIGIKSGFVTLMISLLFAFAIYALIAYAEHEEGDKNA